MPADSFVRAWKFIARPNLCGTPACVKPPPRCVPFCERALQNSTDELKVEKKYKKGLHLKKLLYLCSVKK